MSPLLIVAALAGLAFVGGRSFRRFVPEIVVFLALGVLIGPELLGLINAGNLRALELLTQVALGAVIFLIGDRLRVADLSQSRRLLVPLNVAQIVGAAGAVYVGATLAGVTMPVALVLALIAAETGVLTVTATITEERAAGRFTEVLLASVGVTNVAVAALFALLFPFVLAATGEASGTRTLLVFVEIIVASVVIGLVGGWLLVRVGRSLETSGELLLYLLIVITGLVGTALSLGSSVVLSALIAGLYVANLAPLLADRLFAAIRTLQAPLYLLFFVVAGATIHLDELASVGLLGVVYAVARTVGKVGGAVVGAVVARGREGLRLGLGTGLGLLPHAGMAIALVAFVAEQSSELGPEVSAVVLGSVVVFEVAGPLLLRRVLRSVEDAGRAKGGAPEVLPELEIHRSFSRVLVPVGSAATALPRLAFLLDLVANLRAELVAVHVSRPGTGLSEQEEPEVLAVVRRVAEERSVACTTLHRTSERVAATIVDVARETNADLVILGEPVRDGVPDARRGLVASRVLRNLDIPVLLYPVDPDHPERVPHIYLRRALRAEVADAEADNLPAIEPIDG